MGFKTVINDLAKYLKRMILVNMLVLTLIVPVILISFGMETSRVALITALSSFLLCTANFFFINGFFVRKTESSLTMSYASIQNDYLYDDLTKVYNRRAGLIRLAEEFARARRSGSTLSVAMVDADHFKNVNDTYGHLVGDSVLTHIASALKSGLRECDIVTRYGGEEFLILLPDTSGTQASQPLNRLRRSIAENNFIYNNLEIQMSVSIGIATISSTDEDPMDIVLRADKALYSAKKAGRNKVIYDRRSRRKTDLHPAMSHA
ncbi:MAG TPA: GGDEF domain-containing protein [Dissulfurispiraceae bacterium]|nr:GGDEF domain-containing protein [Dissulfurispiraceae bacterium]